MPPKGNKKGKCHQKERLNIPCSANMKKKNQTSTKHKRVHALNDKGCRIYLVEEWYRKENQQANAAAM